MNDKDIDAMFLGRKAVVVSKVVNLENFEKVKGRFGNGYDLVGYAPKPTNDYCGMFRYRLICAEVDKHNKVIDGVSYKGKFGYASVHYSCGKPSCPKCVDRWRSRESWEIERRVTEASKHFGEPEHINISPPREDWDLPEVVLHRRAIKVAFSRGIIGGSLLFHGARFAPGRGYYWSPHYHVIGFILGGFGDCRRCKKVCFAHPECGGFMGRQYKAFKKDGWICNVLDPSHERVSVFRTAYYETGHATISVNRKRFRCVSYFGICSYRKLKITREKRKRLCKICESKMRKGYHFGSEPLINDGRFHVANAYDENGELCVRYSDDGDVRD